MVVILHTGGGCRRRRRHTESQAIGHFRQSHMSIPIKFFLNRIYGSERCEKKTIKD
jgi:hypothetical protein